MLPGKQLMYALPRRSGLSPSMLSTGSNVECTIACQRGNNQIIFLKVGLRGEGGVTK